MIYKLNANIFYKNKRKMGKMNTIFLMNGSYKKLERQKRNVKAKQEIFLKANIKSLYMIINKLQKIFNQNYKNF